MCLFGTIWWCWRHLLSISRLQRIWVAVENQELRAGRARTQEDQIPSSTPSLTSYLPVDHLSACFRSLLSHFKSRGSLLITSEDTISINIPSTYILLEFRKQQFFLFECGCLSLYWVSKVEYSVLSICNTTQKPVCWNFVTFQNTNDEDQDTLLQNKALQHIKCFKLKDFEKTAEVPTHFNISLALRPWNGW